MRDGDVLGLLLGQWQDSQGNHIQVTRDVAKGYQVLVQRPGQRRGRRFTAYTADDGQVYCGRYVLDLDATGAEEICWRQRSDWQQVSIWNGAGRAVAVAQEGYAKKGCARPFLCCPSCGEEVRAKERPEKILPLFLALCSHLERSDCSAQLHSAKVRFASKILTKFESSLAVHILMDNFLEDPWMVLCSCCLLLERDEALWAQRLFHLGGQRVIDLTCSISTWPLISNISTEPSPWTRPQDAFGPVTCGAVQLPADVNVHFIDTSEGLTFAMSSLSGSNVIGIDFEHSGFGASKEISLMQLATFSLCFIIDVSTLGLDRCQALLALIASKTLLAFDFRSDAALLGHGILKPVDFRECGGLRHLVQRALGQELCKVEQCSCWGRRPLRSSQLHYAALDAWVLLLCAKYLQVI